MSELEFNLWFALVNIDLYSIVDQKFKLINWTYLPFYVRGYSGIRKLASL